MIKKTLIFLFGIIAVLVSILLLIPVFFDADKHLKPYIEDAVTQYLDVDAKIGHLSVSLWGKVSVRVSGIDLIDKQTAQSIVKVDEAVVEAPIAPLFDKKLNLNLISVRPQVNVVSEKDGRLNWSRLIRKPKETEPSKESTGENTKPNWLREFKFTFNLRIEDSIISYKDVIKNSQTKLENLDFIVLDFAVDKPFNYKITSRLNSQQGANKVTGPAELLGTMKLVAEGLDIRGFDTSGKIDLDKIDIRGGSFTKTASDQLNFNFKANVLRTSAHATIDSNIESIRLKSIVTAKSYSPLNVDVVISAEHIDLMKIVKMNVQLQDLAITLHASEKSIDVTASRFKTFKGEYRGTGRLTMAPTNMNVTLKGQIAGVDVNEAIQSQKPEFKDTLKGTLNSDYAISTFGAKADDYKKNLTGSGSFRLHDGSWSALYGLKMLGEKLSAIPVLKDKVKDLKLGDKIETGKSKFKIAGEKIFLTDTLIELKDSRATISGAGDVGFNKQMHFKGVLLAPLGQPPTALRSSDGRARLPFEFSGAFNEPTVNWDVTTNAVARAYVQQEGQKLLEQVKGQIKDENLKKILDKAPEGLEKLLKDIKL